jgi:hypothetical protein
MCTIEGDGSGFMGKGVQKVVVLRQFLRLRR